MDRTGFRIHNNVDGSARIDIYADIDPYWGVSAQSFLDELKAVSASHLEVHINSGGGDVHEGLAIMNSLRDHSAEVTVIVDGLAASAASFIAVGAGDRLIMHEASTLMIHDAWTFTGGDAAGLEKTVETLNKMSDLIAGIYARKAGTPVEEWRDAMREESWFTAEEAVLVGLADEVRSSAAPEPVSAGMRSRILNSGAFKYARRSEAPTPTILTRRGRSASDDAPEGEKGETMGFLNDIAARLGITGAEVTEEQLLAALDETLAEQAEDPAAPASDEENATEPEGDEVEDVAIEEGEVPAEVPAGEGGDELTTTVDKARLAELEADAELGRKLREEKEQASAAEAVEAAVKDGRLGAAARDKWTAKYLADPAGTDGLLASLPKGRINRAETGHTHVPESDEASDGITELSNAFGLNY